MTRDSVCDDWESLLENICHMPTFTDVDTCGNEEETRIMCSSSLCQARMKYEKFGQVCLEVTIWINSVGVIVF